MKELLIDGGIMFIAMFSQIYIQATIFNIAFSIGLSKIHKCIYSSILALTSTVLKLININFLTAFTPICFVLLSMLMLHSFKKIAYIKALLYSMLVMIISIPVELLSGIIAFKILKLPNNVDNVYGMILIYIIITLWYAIIALALQFFKKWKNVTLQFNSRVVGINIAIVFLLVAPNIVFYALNKYNYPLFLLIYNIVANIILVALAIYNTHNNIQLETKKRDLENSEMHNKSLTELVDSIRVFKHDYNNIVHALGGYIVMSDISGLKRYYEGLRKESNRVKQIEAISPVKINEPSVYGIFASKYQIAELKDISFNLESMFDYQRLDMPIYDFCKILGILLDNALEAAEETDEKEINILVRESRKDGVQLISIENTYKEKDVDIERIYEKDYSNKNRNSGLGLWTVKNIIAKNPNVVLHTNKDDMYFRQQLYIQVKPAENSEAANEEKSVFQH
mgnify:CR=1 FL=1